MSEPLFTSPLEDTVAIVGVGLIGGSLAAALKQRKIARRVIGVGRDPARIEAARVAGLIDEAQTNLAEAVASANLTVVCTPVGQVVTDVRTAQRALAGLPDGSERLLTDVGSTKASICEGLADVVQFIGSHPIAGSHRQGFEAADARLFEGRVCVLTPLSSASKLQVERLDKFWRAVGMRTVQMTPVAHDAALAMTSHLPHVAAAALARTLVAENRDFVGSGFRDTARLAAGSPDLWLDILLTNSAHVAHGIETLQQALNEFRSALSSGDAHRLRSLLEASQAIRTSLDRNPPS